MPWLAGARLDLDDAVGDLRYLELEQPLDQAGVGAADHDLGALRGAAHLDDVGLRAVTRLRAFERNLLGLREQRLDAPEVEQRVTGVGLLDDAGDDVALAVGVLLELAVAFHLADPLAHHLTERLGGDAAELVAPGGVVALVDPVAVLVEVVRRERELHRAGVDLDHHFVGGAGAALVGRGERIDQHVQQRVLGQALLLGQHPDRFGHV